MIFYQAKDVAQLVRTKPFRSSNFQSFEPNFALTSAFRHMNMGRLF